MLDTPDFTSNAAQREGDVTLAMLPWFDRLIVVADHERWFDRQVAEELGSAARRLGQSSMVVFNRTAQGALGQTDRDRLVAQARQLKAAGTCILDYHPGRGFRRFEPQVVREMIAFAAAPPVDRSTALRKEIATHAREVLEINRQRTAHFQRLSQTLSRSTERLELASWWECVTAVMSSEERDRLDVFSRFLGLSQMRDWVDRQRHRLEQTMAKISWLRLPTARSAVEATTSSETFSREQSGIDFFTAHCERQLRRLNEDAAGSAFWDHLRQSTGRHPVLLGLTFTEGFRPRAEQAIRQMGEALEAWDVKVRRECQGAAPHVVGSLSMAMIGIAAVLVAVPGPIGALTPLLAAGAIKAGLVKIGVAGAFGAAGGRSMVRLVEIVREKLLASPEFNAVRAAAEAFRACLDEHAQAAARQLEQSARNLTLTEGEPLWQALEEAGRAT